MTTLCQSNGSDLVTTPSSLVKQIIDHYKPSGKILDPCRGTGAFYDLLENPKDWCEITQGRDFYDYSDKANWVISNPPWSQLRRFINKATSISDNVVFLCLVNAFWMQRRLREIEDSGFGIREILLVDTPPRPWPWSGMQLGATHLQRGYGGPIILSDGRR